MHGFNSCQGLNFFSLSHACVIINYFIFQNSPSLSFITIHDDMDIVDPSSMQVARHIRTDSKITSLFMSSRSSTDRAPAQCSGGHRFDSCRGLRFFSLSYARAIVDYFMFNNA